MDRFYRVMFRTAVMAGLLTIVVGTSTPARATFPPPKDLVITPPPTGTGGEKEVDPPPVVTPPMTCNSPEPGTLALTVIGIAGMAGMRRLRRK
jgi:hypothetical protein